MTPPSSHLHAYRPQRGWVWVPQQHFHIHLQRNSGCCSFTEACEAGDCSLMLFALGLWLKSSSPSLENVDHWSFVKERNKFSMHWPLPASVYIRWLSGSEAGSNLIFEIVFTLGVMYLLTGNQLDCLKCIYISGCKYVAQLLWGHSLSDSIAVLGKTS